MFVHPIKSFNEVFYMPKKKAPELIDMDYGSSQQIDDE